jgi:hypothetical protein
MSHGNLFGSVPRPGASAAGGGAAEAASAAASQGLAQMSSFFSSVSDAGKQALSKVQENQHVQTLQVICVPMLGYGQTGFVLTYAQLLPDLASLCRDNKQGTASKLAAEAGSTVSATPLGAVGSFAQQQAEATKSLITGQQKVSASLHGRLRVGLFPD